MRLNKTFATFAILTGIVPGSGMVSHAADYPAAPPANVVSLPAAAPGETFDWSGLYGAISASWNTQHVSMGKMATYSGIAFPAGTLDRRNTQKIGYGAFVGYNYQMDDLVLGLEIDYVRPDISGSRTVAGAAVIGAPRVGVVAVTPGFAAASRTTITGNSTGDISDIALLKVRAGYVMGRIMPFGTLGWGLMRYDNVASATTLIEDVETNGAVVNPLGTSTATTTSYRKRGFTNVFSVGVGIDYAITTNAFVRGEYQYVLIGSDRGQKGNLNLTKIAAGLKF